MVSINYANMSHKCLCNMLAQVNQSKPTLKMLLTINIRPLLLYTAKELELHYLLSGDADGVIILWELSLVDGKVHPVSLFSCFLTLSIMFKKTL